MTSAIPRSKVLVARAIFESSLERLREHFEVVTNPEDEPWAPELLQTKAQGCWGMLTTGSERVDGALLEAIPTLRAVCNMAVGYNNIDVQAAVARGVVCTNTPDVLTETTADFGFALMMATARRITESERYLREGRWTRWSHDMMIGPDIHGATLGILGMGRIGQAIAKRGALGFGMSVLYHNRTPLDAATERACGASYVSKAQLLAQADHLVIVVPYSPSSHHAIGAAELAQMKPSATLVNIARGGVVDDAALAQALAVGQIAAAGLDVFEGEPKVHPELLKRDNVVLTPHIASASLKTRLAMADLAVDNLIALHTDGVALTAVPEGLKAVASS
jgi:gluconate 2-dehydrogenase